MEADPMLSPDFDDLERRLLRTGVVEWGGPARCTEETAVAMGFDGVRHLVDSADRLAAAVANGDPLPRSDWLRVLLATEIAFASNTIGSGLDWSSTSGLSDEQSIRALRSVQLKLSGVGGLLGVAFGTLPARP